MVTCTFTCQFGRSYSSLRKLKFHHKFQLNDVSNHFNARACSSYECFILRAARLSSKPLGQGYGMECLKSSLRKFYGRYWDLIKKIWSLPLPNVTWHSGTWPYTMTPSIDQTLHQIANLLPSWTLLPISTLLPNYGGFHRTLQRVQLANRGGLLLRTPGPVPFGTCICYYVQIFLS